MASWEDIEITINGQRVKAKAPIIVSASRSTDIPAFYAEWFFNRLEKGYSAWTNPFNGVKSYISYAKTRFIVFWSKNPRPLLDYFHILKEKNIKCYIQYTLNDYEKEKLENVPKLATRIETFKLLVMKLGLGAVVWRFDPMILTDDISIEDLIQKVQNIGDQLKGYTEKLVFSYADITTYKKVRAYLEKNGIPYHEWTEQLMEEFAIKLSKMNLERGWNYQLATCAEKIDIEKYGIIHNSCIDGNLIARLAWEDKKLMDFMKVKTDTLSELPLFPNQDSLHSKNAEMPSNKDSHKKDYGQRTLCKCMAAKDIGEYNTCPHLCKYCYANTSEEVVRNNFECHKMNPRTETITGK